jgi:hypothetical protein
MNREALEQFIQQVSRWRQFVKARIRVGLAVKTDGGWSAWYSYTAFLPDVPQKVDIFTLETASLRAYRDLLLFKDDQQLDAALAEMRDKPEEINGGGWHFKLSPHNDLLEVEYENLHPARFPGPKRLPAVTLRWTNESYRELSDEIKAIDQELQTYAEPFDGFVDLASTLSIPLGFDELNRRRVSETVLLPPVDLLYDRNTEPHSDLRGGVLSLVLRISPEVSPINLRFGIKAFRPKDQPERLTVNGGTAVVGDDGLLRLEHRLSTSDAPLALVFVYLDGGDLLGKWFIRDIANSFNDRMLLHRAMDPRDQFKSSFFDRPEQFEDRVLLLLTLMGLTALKYGKVQTDAPDIMAISASRHVYLVECTTGDINSRGKLQRLSDRAKQIGERLSNTSNPPVGVVSVIFTSLPREDTAMHWETAATFKIALVTRENIVSLLDNLDTVTLPDQLYNATLALIPSKKI